LPAPERLVLEGVEKTQTGIIVRVRGKTPPQCPACSSCQVSYHSQYLRELRDLPGQGQPVRLHLRLRRFRCRNRQCERKIFAERLPGVVAPKARETERRCEVVRRVGYPECAILSFMPKLDSLVNVLPTIWTPFGGAESRG